MVNFTHEQVSHPRPTPQIISPPPEPRWFALAAVLAASGLYTALPDSLTVGPRWLLPSLACGLAGLTTLAYRRGRRTAHVVLGHTLTAVLTLFMVWPLVLLVMALPQHKEPPVALLRSAVAPCGRLTCWGSRCDTGGWTPAGRTPATPGTGHETGAFLFPRMTLEAPAGREAGAQAVVAAVHRLPVRGFQHQHRFFADRRGGAGAVGQGAGDDAGGIFAGGRGDSRRPRREHPLILTDDRSCRLTKKNIRGSNGRGGGAYHHW